MESFHNDNDLFVMHTHFWHLFWIRNKTALTHLRVSTDTNTLPYTSIAYAHQGIMTTTISGYTVWHSIILISHHYEIYTCDVREEMAR